MHLWHAAQEDKRRPDAPAVQRYTDIQTIAPEERIQVSLDQDVLRRAVASLPDREQEVLKLRYGMNGDGEPKSLEEIGRTLGLTRERVRQVEAKALERLAVNREIEALRAA